MPNYLLAIKNEFDKDSLLIITEKQLLANHSGSINAWVTSELKTNGVCEKDVVYELRPVFKFEHKLVATKFKSL